jgi:hypothetical protein
VMVRDLLSVMVALYKIFYVSAMVLDGLLSGYWPFLCVLNNV